MIRGTTPTFRFILNDDQIDLTQMDHIYVTFQQGNYVMTKSGDDLDLSEKQVDVYFNQNESLRFKQGVLSVQINYTFDNGKRGCTNIVNVSVGKNLVGSILP